VPPGAPPEPWAARLRSFPLRREIFRAILAFLLYLGFYWAWSGTGLHTAYLDLLSRPAGALVRRLGHFPPVPGLPGPRLESMHTLGVFLLAVFLVSTRVPWPRRVRALAVSLVAVLALDFVSAILGLQLQAAKNAFEGPGILILLPVEYNALECLWYVAYVIPLQAGPFVLLILSALANVGFLEPKRGGRETSPPFAEETGGKRTGIRPGRKRILALTVTAAVALPAVVVTAALWMRAREFRPLHAGAHARLADLYFERNELPSARTQYLAATAGGSESERVWRRLTLIAYRKGDRAEALRILTRAMETVRDPALAEQFRALRDDIDMEDSPARNQIIAIPPPPSP